MRKLFSRPGCLVLGFLAGLLCYHLAVFYVWPWWMARQSSHVVAGSSTSSAGAVFEADEEITVAVDTPGVQQWWTLLWYALRSDRPRERALLVLHEGGPKIHSLYLIEGEKRHRIVIQGLEVYSQQPAMQHLAAR